MGGDLVCQSKDDVGDKISKYKTTRSKATEGKTHMGANKTEEQVHGEVSEYYGHTLSSNRDLKSCACSCAPPAVHRPILAKIHDEILSKFYGCGNPIPELIEGQTVLDLGCGTGRDAYICSSLVGQNGRVIGIDMTPEQLAVASRHIDHQTQQFGFTRPNIEFHKGHIENLKQLDDGASIPDNSVDIVISNCVINLCPDKSAVFKEIHRVLRDGGEFYFSDVISDRRIPDDLRANKELWGECLSGALYLHDCRRMLEDARLPEFRVVSIKRLQFQSAEVFRLLGPIKFFSVTMRCFKLPGGAMRAGCERDGSSRREGDPFVNLLTDMDGTFAPLLIPPRTTTTIRMEDQCEDYGQLATYKGTIPGFPAGFPFDQTHEFPKDRPCLVCVAPHNTRVGHWLGRRCPSCPGLFRTSTQMQWTPPFAYTFGGAPGPGDRTPRHGRHSCPEPREVSCGYIGCTIIITIQSSLITITRHSQCDLITPLTAHPTTHPPRPTGNTASILTQSRFAPHFVVTPRGPHEGVLPVCGMPVDEMARGGCCGGGCCGGHGHEQQEEEEHQQGGCCGGQGQGGCGCGAESAGCGCGGAEAAGGCCGGQQGGCGCGGQQGGCGCGGQEQQGGCCGGAEAAGCCGGQQGGCCGGQGGCGGCTGGGCGGCGGERCACKARAAGAPAPAPSATSTGPVRLAADSLDLDR
ncbi:putative Arsenite methyltransferase [Paratrimastix pyriformis]|uniref:Arsenite methyltransferase n=1 Tax=Paratrimastix pyriformis TaxID=342808 RepID=A0ABQ8UHB6_9EUKA|nr:putative Arsenite methyltransferase [Paratrimastix pyriformis]